MHPDLEVFRKRSLGIPDLEIFGTGNPEKRGGPLSKDLFWDESRHGNLKK